MNKPAIREAIQSMSKNELTAVLCRLHHAKGYATKVRHHTGETLIVYRRQLSDGIERGLLWVSVNEPLQRNHLTRLERMQAKLDANRAAVVTPQESALEAERNDIEVLTLGPLTSAISSLDDPTSVFPSSTNRPQKIANSWSRTPIQIIRPEKSGGVWQTATTNNTAVSVSHDSYWDAMHQSRQMNRE